MRLCALLAMTGLAIGGFFAEYALFGSGLPRFAVACGVIVLFVITIGCISYLAQRFLGERTASTRRRPSDAER